MKKSFWLQSWSRLFFWANALSVAGFYLFIWQRSLSSKNEQVRALPPLAQLERKNEHPLVSIILPARNEEQNIRRCVESLLLQDYGNYEVIVVDDGSTDRTAEILDQILETNPQGDRAYVLRLRGDLPEGWAGKPHAIHMGAQEARGEWLLFTDADTWHAPNSLRSAVVQATEEQADLFSIGAAQELPGFWDRVMMPMAYLGMSMLYPPKEVNNPRRKVAIANGQYILIRRSVYNTLGGYARPELRSTVVDDRDLAELVKRSGYRLRFVDSLGLVHVHMYRNLGEIWRGWRKNVFLGNRGGIPFFLLQILGLPMVTIVPFLVPFLTLLDRRLGRIERLGIAATGLIPLLTYRIWLNRLLEVPAIYALTHPLAGGLFTGILGQSFWRVLSGVGVDWRGRTYSGKTVASISHVPTAAQVENNGHVHPSNERLPKS